MKMKTFVGMTSKKELNELDATISNFLCDKHVIEVRYADEGIRRIVTIFYEETDENDKNDENDEN